MKNRLIVIAGITLLPLSVAFADMNNSTTTPNTDGTTNSAPMDQNNNPSTGTDRHDKSNINRPNDSGHNMDKKGTHDITDDVPVKKTPNDVPIKQPSDLNPSHPSTTY